MHPVGPTLSGLAATKSLSPDAASGETDIFLMKVDSWGEISGLGQALDEIVQIQLADLVALPFG